MNLNLKIEKKVYDKERKCKSCGWNNTRFIKLIKEKVEMCPTCFFDYLE